MTFRRRRHRVFNLVNLGALIMVAVTALPLYWLAVNSFKTPAELGASTPTAVPHEVTFGNYAQAWVDNGFGRYLLNSVVVSVSATVIVLVLATFAGYALGRLGVRGSGPIMIGLLMISVFPSIAVLAPLYLLERQLGLLNSYQGLVLPYVAFHLPFAIWIMRGYLVGLPPELEEAARVDGAGTTRTLVSIVLPQALPGLFTAGVFTFTASWTEFLMALTFNSEDAFRTVPVGIALFGTQYEVPFGAIFGAAMMATVPIAILVLAFRRTVVSGLSSGAVKG
ncbi:carbohydrate ABC transporter permease [Spirillospora sp. NPDC029432]|uniref:carbohydrate ABC transporter permease n=1 Tax=Spirillospora sp. NPDC029432 TaxID=3154599 RepID=UPI0034547F6D